MYNKSKKYDFFILANNLISIFCKWKKVEKFTKRIDLIYEGNLRADL